MITAITNARVFDGKQVVAGTPVVVLEGEKIAGIFHTIPPGAEVIDAEGSTLMPGLIDSHVHTSMAGLRTSLVFGVTTALEMGAERSLADRQQIAGSDDMADLRSAGIPLSALCGHPNQMKFKPKPGESRLSGCNEHTQLFPTASTPEEAVAFVNMRIKEGSDYIKLLVEDGTVVGAPGLPVPDRAVFKAAVDEAHRQAKMVIAHALTLNAASEVIELGVDGLSHVFIDRPHTPKIIDAIARSGAFVIPCLVLDRSVTGQPASDFAADPRVARRLSKEWIATLNGRYNTYPQGKYADAVATVVALKQSGVPLLAGTDSSVPNPEAGGLAQGASLHHELQLLVRAGLTPVEALCAATSVPARIFGLIDRGRIAPATRADLLLVDGDPTTNIVDTLSIRQVWRLGVAQQKR